MTQAIPLDRLASLIDEAAAIPTIKVVVFTGGECFLLGDNLDSLITRASSYGLDTRVVTNGYWAVTPEAAKRRLAALKAAGLKEMNISTGTEHEQYVPRERVVHGALAAVAQGLTTLVTVEVQENSSLSADYFSEHELLGPFVKSGEVFLLQNVWIENGGATEISHSPDHSRFRPEMISGCNTILNVLSVTPDMELIACCGLHMERLPELSLGSVAETSLGDAIDRAPEDFMKLWIHVDGPERILQFVKRHRPDYELPLDSVHPCQTCLYVYEDPIVRDVLFKHYKDEEDRIVGQYMKGLATNAFQDRLLSADPGVVRAKASSLAFAAREGEGR